MNLFEYHELMNARRADDMRAFHAAELIGLTRERAGSATKGGGSWLRFFRHAGDSRAGRPATGRTSSAAR